MKKKKRKRTKRPIQKEKTKLTKKELVEKYGLIEYKEYTYINANGETIQVLNGKKKKIKPG